MTRPDPVEAGKAGSERIQPKQNKRERNLQNTLRGNRGQDSKRTTVCQEAVRGWGL